MIEASNLGQVIGRLIYGDVIGVPVKRNAIAPGRRVDRRSQVVELIGRLGSVVCADLTRELGITVGNATVTLYCMHDEGLLERTGERGKYRYSLPRTSAR